MHGNRTPTSPNGFYAPVLPLACDLLFVCYFSGINLVLTDSNALSFSRRLRPHFKIYHRVSFWCLEGNKF